MVKRIAESWRSFRHGYLVKNLGWLTADKLVRMFLGLFVGAATARHLEPAGFGALNYGYALVGLLGVIVGLGLDPLLQRDLIKNSAQGSAAIATSLALRIFSGFLIYCVFWLFAGYASPNPILTKVSLIMSLSLLNAWTPTFDVWFQSQIQAKYSVYAQNLAFLTTTLLRFYFIFFGYGVVAFAWAAVLESFLSGILIYVLFAHRFARHVLPRIDWSLSKTWLRESWTLIFSNLAVMIYMRIDQVMLGRMASEGDLGVYSAAVRVSEIGYFIPTMLASTLLPAIVRSKGVSSAIYEARRQRFFDLTSVIAFAIILPSVLLAKPLINLLYGNTFQGADGILIVHIWSSLFVFTGVARGQYLLIENLLRFSLYSTIAGAILNVALNLVLIPRMGGLGCAWATLIAYAASAFGSSFLNNSVRPIGSQQLRSFVIPYAIKRLVTA